MLISSYEIRSLSEGRASERTAAEIFMQTDFESRYPNIHTDTLKQVKMVFASWILPADEILTGCGLLRVPGHLLMISAFI